MKKRKIAVVITARPSYSRIKTALIAMNKHPEIDLKIIVAASALLDRYGSAVNYIEQDGLEIHSRVFMVLEGENPASMAKTTGIGIIELSSVFGNLKPDIVVTIADRYETMATAIAASYMNIPLAHIQGGEVTGNIDEKVRHAITKLADIHLVASDDALERLIKLGERRDRIYNTGCPSIDLAAEIMENPKLNFDIYQRYGGVGDCFDLSHGYVVVLQHPVTNEYDRSRAQIEETLYALKDSDVPVLWFWPNVDAGADGTSKGIRMFREKFRSCRMHFFKNMEGRDFLRLLYNSKCLVGNSSVGIRECSFLGVPVINIGSRQEGRIRGENVIDVDYDSMAIKEAVTMVSSDSRPKRSCKYGNGKAGELIAKTLNDAPLSIEKRITY